MGAWIEIFLPNEIIGIIGSHPLWVRGLKSSVIEIQFVTPLVAPFMGAWIEIKAW